MLRGRVVLAARRLDGRGQPHGEFASLVLAVASHFDEAAMRIDKVLDQRQANAEPAARLMRVLLREQLEDVGEQPRRDADAVVPHLDDGVGPFPRFSA